jgi:RNA polymerase sigma factor for flagellar operon FliA
MACKQPTMNAPKRTLTREDYERFLPLVRRIAMRLARRVPSHISIGDLISSGWVGLVEAFSRSNPDMPNEEFEAYASHRVRGAMLDYLRGLDPATRQARNASRRVSRSISQLTRALGRPPEEEEIADALGLAVDAYRDLLTQIASAGMSRLELVDLDQIDAVPDKSEAPDDRAEQRLLAEHVAGAIERLPLRLQQVLALYYQEDCTLREIGAVLQVSESRVCQLHAEAMHRLRADIGRE